DRLYYDNGNMGYSLSQSQYISDRTFATEHFKQLYDLYNGTLESMQMVQGLLNDIIADNDDSVNKNKKTFWLKRV
ncbi:hypothetical protein, partial [Paenibacillus odorifer]|uniref:hypothetical protein n=1 Tax=Paenibacillus odorifer TaxID=189426 RepID=UPI00097A64FD